MLTLDSLSLLLSKQNPTQAGLTLSQQLREMVGIGTLGADQLDEPIVNPKKANDEAEAATGWTIMQINQARDAAMDAGRLLQREVEAESKYWEDVMAVKKSGWSICRVPQERHTLGVKFGFSEGG
jgi:mediator of RNA polymerase II transcription subunit 17